MEKTTPPSHQLVLDLKQQVSEEIVEWKEVSEKKLVRKIDYRILPPVFLIQLLSFMDRSNVGNARIEGLVDDLHMRDSQYQLGLTLFFVGYIVFELPSNLALKSVRPRIWLPALTAVCGIVVTLTGITNNAAGFQATRFFLGVSEAGMFPGIIWTLSMWYKRRERQTRIAAVACATALAGAFGGIFAWGITHMRGIVWENGWRWIFILEGLITLLVAVFAYIMLGDFPSTARFLSPADRRASDERLAADSDATLEEKFSWSGVREALLDANCWLYCLGYHTMVLPVYSFALFLPSIIRGFGYPAATSQLLTIPPNMIAFVFGVAVSIISERVRARAVFAVGCSSLAVLGYLLLITSPDPVGHTRAMSYAGACLATGGIAASTILLVSWPASNVSGQVKRATAGAMQVSVASLGGIIASHIYPAADGPRYVRGHAINLGYLVLNVLVSLVLRWRLKRANAQRALIAEELTDVTKTENFLGDKDPRWRYHY